jgi:hypothetical protein
MGKVKEYFHEQIEQETRWFRANNTTDKLKGSVVDFDNGIIRGVSLCTVGEALGHGVWLEQSFIEDIVKFGNASKNGVKARFGHPNMSGEALGTFIGRFENFSVNGSKAIADLKLSEVAKKSPNGDLYAYILEMADENPDEFGASIVFKVKENYFYNEDGEREKIIFGEFGVLNENYTDQKIYVAMKSLNGADLVDEPAANPEGLFSQFSSAKLHADKFAVIATEFLKSNPQIAVFLQENPHKIQEFMKKFESNKKGIKKPLDEDEDELFDKSKGDDEGSDDEGEGEDTEGSDADADKSEGADGDETLLGKISKMFDDKFSKVEKSLTAIEKRVGDLEENPTADPTFSKKKKDNDSGKTIELSSWEREAEKRRVKS